MSLNEYLPTPKGSGFIQRPPLTRRVPPSMRSVILYEEVKYDVGCPGSGDRITVPVGFQTDYASVPRWLWPIFPPMGVYSGAAIIHDYLYKRQNRCRLECDDIFLEAMTALGVSKTTRYAMYYAVRIWGQIAWDNNRRI